MRQQGILDDFESQVQNKLWQPKRLDGSSAGEVLDMIFGFHWVLFFFPSFFFLLKKKN